MGKTTAFPFLFPGLCFPGFILVASPVQEEDMEPHIKAHVTNAISFQSFLQSL